MINILEWNFSNAITMCKENFWFLSLGLNMASTNKLLLMSTEIKEANWLSTILQIGLLSRREDTEPLTFWIWCSSGLLKCARAFWVLRHKRSHNSNLQILLPSVYIPKYFSLRAGDTFHQILIHPFSQTVNVPESRNSLNCNLFKDKCPSIPQHLESSSSR